jgi:hypothetical protein
LGDEAGRWPATECKSTRTQGVALGSYEAGPWREGSEQYEIAFMSAAEDVGNDKGFSPVWAAWFGIENRVNGLSCTSKSR